VYSIYILVGARELGRADALGVSTVVCVSAAASLALSAPLTGPEFPREAAGWLAVGAIAACSVVAILAFFAGLKRVGPATASIVSTLEPVVTIVLAWAVLGETLTALQLAGGAVVLGVAARLARAEPVPANP
jgi:drug/metabolite transporter (DMT)-like permease